MDSKKQNAKTAINCTQFLKLTKMNLKSDTVRIEMHTKTKYL